MKKKPVKPIVLLVDDYPDAREMYAEYLQFSGFDVVEAGNGVEALERAIDRTPDVILMDLSLPVMDGWEATRRLKADDRTKHIPVLAVTGHALTGISEDARRAGCDGFITSRVCRRIARWRSARCSITARQVRRRDAAPAEENMPKPKSRRASAVGPVSARRRRKTGVPRANGNSSRTRLAISATRQGNGRTDRSPV